jgi:uncharacterized protein
MTYPEHMYVVELAFDDDPRRLAARPAHRERLLALRATGRLMMAGPWEDESGAMLVFSTDRGIVEQILSEDPYYSTPGVRVKYVREWLPIVGGDKFETQTRRPHR